MDVVIKLPMHADFFFVVSAVVSSTGKPREEKLDVAEY